MKQNYFTMKRWKMLILIQSSSLFRGPTSWPGIESLSFQYVWWLGTGRVSWKWKFFFRIREKISGVSLSQHWLCVPHVVENSSPQPYSHPSTPRQVACFHQYKSVLSTGGSHHSISWERKAKSGESRLSIVWKAFSWRVYYILLWGNSLTLWSIIIGLKQWRLINTYWI